MKKLTVTLLVALLAVSTSAFAQISGNDSNCDISVAPAATLLLPYFEVDVSGTSGQTTLFTVTNVSLYPQIAHVTLWTDLAVPVLSFNLYLTGYGVRSINLADVIGRGVIAGEGAGAAAGSVSSVSSGNLLPANGCNAPSSLTESASFAVRAALTIGVFTAGGESVPCPRGVPIGLTHVNAIGYATVDVVSNCTNRFPDDPLYYANDILFDNVLIGDYQNLGPHLPDLPAVTFDATGNPMVHIRAVPEGGGAGTNVTTTLPYTFYDRYTPASSRTIDRRQPLPSTFAARFVEGGASGFRTNLTVWREAVRTAECRDSIPMQAEIVRFDEHENPFILESHLNCSAFCEANRPVLPASSSTTTTNDAIYPPLEGGDVGGWLYLNLNNGGSSTYSVTHIVGSGPVTTNVRTNLSPAGSSITAGPRPSQNWVTVTMFGSHGTNGMTAELDAAPLGNGCTPASFQIFQYDPGDAAIPTQPIAPAGGVFVCPPGTTLTNGTTSLCTGTSVNPPP